MIRQVHAEDWKRLRDARLRALAEAPYAFSSKLADERAFPEEVWRSRAAALVGAVVDWARAHGAARVGLSVERGNAVASRLYERCGFTPRDPPPALQYDPGAGSDVMVLDL